MDEQINNSEWASLALLALLARVSRNIANDRLVAALEAAAEARARARRQR